MTRARRHSNSALRTVAVVVLVIAAPGAGGSAAAGGDSETRIRPPSGLIGPVPRQRGCALTDFQGPSTTLYADRPYHTNGPVPELSGLSFCRSKRHNQALWILDVTRPTTLYTLASESHSLEAGGWRLLPRTVRVDAAGLVLDRLYSRRVHPGRYAIHHGHATTANPVFFDSADARVTPIPAPDDE